MTNSVDEKFIQLSLARTRYLEIGSGEPLILLHGMGIGNSADSFAPLIGGLAAQLYFTCRPATHRWPHLEQSCN
jgi:hypothetical protein